MATDENRALSKTKESILIGISASMAIQNVSNHGIGWTIKDSGNNGGVLNSGDTIKVDYDIDVWAISESGQQNIHIVRF